MIQENISLKSYNTFGVEVFAKKFAEVEDLETLLKILKKTPRTEKLLFLGGGSNILFTRNFQGTVVKLNLKGIKTGKTKENLVLVTASAGENWHRFVKYCLDEDYGGLENLSLIPGNVGTSPMQNIGAYGVEIKDTFVSCSVLNLDTREVKIFDKKICDFGYRDSIFKKAGKGKYVILDVTFALTTKNHLIKTEYGVIKEKLAAMNVEKPSIQDVSRAVIAIRQSKLPDPKMVGNAGSFFKNPTISRATFEKLKEIYPNLPGYEIEHGTKIPAAWLIENCGWKGKQIGNVACHNTQPLVIINATGKASGKEIYDFSQKVIDSVAEKFGILLEREVNII